MQSLVSLFNRVFPRLGGWAVIAVALVVVLWVTHPAQLGVVVYKCALVTLAAVLGYYIDRSLFPYARPHAQIKNVRRLTDNRYAIELIPALLMLRRTVIVLACILGLTLGL